MHFPVVLKIEVRCLFRGCNLIVDFFKDSCRLEDNQDGSTTARLRLSDSVESYSGKAEYTIEVYLLMNQLGFVCKTTHFQDLILNASVRIDSTVRGVTDDKK